MAVFELLSMTVGHVIKLTTTVHLFKKISNMTSLHFWQKFINVATPTGCQIYPINLERSRLKFDCANNGKKPRNRWIWRIITFKCIITQQEGIRLSLEPVVKGEGDLKNSLPENFTLWPHARRSRFGRVRFKSEPTDLAASGVVLLNKIQFVFTYHGLGYAKFCFRISPVKYVHLVAISWNSSGF